MCDIGDPLIETYLSHMEKQYWGVFNQSDESQGRKNRKRTEEELRYPDSQQYRNKSTSGGVSLLPLVFLKPAANSKPLATFCTAPTSHR
ncbi:hypothetical protein IRJ41_022790 [Triplophysa rosa]|uniref:Uncharacterized protein n=1 Tax=Triplophysa rosa TaxID=992332 RepID=A0A9W7WJX0_TRIRA|nr:hypothetical protein IRJ41_022790 [Triplophysa rosa]